MFKTIVTALAVSLLIQTPAQAHDEPADVITKCHTTNRGERHITSVSWSSGRAVRRVDLTVSNTLFTGVRDLISSRPGKLDPTVRSCRVDGEGRVIVRTKLRRYVFATPLPVAPTPVEPTAPSPGPPTVWGTWDRPIVLQTQVDANWAVESAAATWNAALPTDRQITVTTDDCSTTSGVACIPVEPLNIASWTEETGAAPLGQALPWYLDGRMLSCVIQLNPTIDASVRPYVMAHELAHCLGLPHWDTEGYTAWTIMATGASPTSHTVTSWDLAWLRSAYAV